MRSLSLIVTIICISNLSFAQDNADDSSMARPKMTREEAKIIQKKVSEQYGLASSMSVKINGNLKIEFMLILPGIFNMGSYKTKNELATTYGKEERVFDLEYPQHKVTITKPFYCGIFEVTQKQWVAIMGDNPSKHKGESLPV
jgi:formylglycine-generating enzyme required for sulfatase activity